MNTEQNITNDITAINPNLDNLKQAFPHCFDKNGDFDFAKFKTELSASDINLAKEGYSLDWLGKSYARLLASDAATTLLKEDEAHNAKSENANSQNLLIKGDNLEVLKHLSNAYYEKVKMIYIDPPYNTGSDGFVYNDDRKFTGKQLQDLAGVNEDEAKRILEFTQSKSNSHSAWLTFMYPRLYIAKQLLKEDGVIFVSIDDNEVAQLRLLMDEVFGEENWIGTIVWKNATDNNPTQIAVEHEYIVAFAKSKANLDSEWNSKISDIKTLLVNKGNELIGKYPDAELLKTEYNKWYRKYKNQLWPLDRYKFIDIDGIYTGSQSVHNPGKEGYRYDVIHPITKKACKQPLMGYRFPESSMNELLQNGKILFGEDETKIIELKVYAKEYSLKLSSVIDLDGRIGAYDLRELFPDKKVFTNPKPFKLISQIIAFVLNKEGEIILDFFGGSGTTAHSVMELNSEDGGNRKFILAQLPELIDAKKSKGAYDFVIDELGITPPTIFEITKERIIRTAKQIDESNNTKIINTQKELEKLRAELPTEENQLAIEGLQAKILQRQIQDLGFKVFETIPIWDDYDFKAEKLANSEKLFDDDKLTDEDIKALFTTWKTYDGSLLTQSVELVDLAGYNAYYTKQKLYLMYKGFTTETLKALLEKIDIDANFNPTAIIAFGYYFESKALREIAENIKTYNNKKNIDIDFITRY